MTTRIAGTVAAVVLILGAPAAIAQSYTAPAGISVLTAPGGSSTAPFYDDLTTGSLAVNRGGQVSVRLPELSTDDGPAVKPASRRGGAGSEPLTD